MHLDGYLTLLREEDEECVCVDVLVETGGG